MKRITIFTGNRAEFGILFPVIVELSKAYSVDILFSGGHVLPQWNTYEDSIKQLDNAGIRYNPYRIELPTSGNAYVKSLGVVYEYTVSFFTNNDSDFALVLGDRVESFGFALGAFYSRVPLIHVSGGDVVDASNFDNNARHSMTKVASYHMVESESARNVVRQLGEEDERVINIGNLSFDYERMGFLTKRDELIERYRVDPDEKIGILTFHPAVDKTSGENYEDFLTVYDGVVSSKLSKVFITYPNNDPGYDKIIDYLESVKEDERIRIVKSFGTFNYLGMMNCFDTVIIGNSSSGVMETLYYQTPALNIGDRQNGRVHGSNVINCNIEKNEIRKGLNDILENYDSLKKSYENERFLFGDGRAALRAVDFLKKQEDFGKEGQLFKKFIKRNID